MLLVCVFKLTRSHFGLVPHDAHSASVHTGEPHHDVLGIVGHDLEEVSLVHDLNRGNEVKIFLPAENTGGVDALCVCGCACVCVYILTE